MELDSELHRRRAVKQREFDESIHHTSVSDNETLLADSKTINHATKDAVDESSSQSTARIWTKLAEGSTLLLKGVGFGYVAGVAIGAIYSLRTRHTRPLWVMASAGLNVGLLGGIFVGFREMLPRSLERLYWNTIASDEEKRLQIPISVTWQLPGLELPSFFEEMSVQHKEYMKTAVSGALAGYIMTRLKATENARLSNLSLGHVHSSGLRGGLVWALFFTGGHGLQYSISQWGKVSNDNDTIDDTINTMAGETESQSESRQTVFNPVSKWLRYLGIDLTTIFPNVHSTQDYEYREYLEAKVRLLETEIEVQEKLQRRRQRHLQELRRSE